MKGIYCLIVNLAEIQRIQVSKAGESEFLAGNYFNIFEEFG